MIPEIKAYRAVDEFEERIAEYAGSKYAVSVDSCCNALFLCFKYCTVARCFLPKYTYPGVACAVINAGGYIHFTDKSWQGVYQIAPYNIWDGALRFRKKMFKGGYHCLSFHAKKHLPIGRGGMILTDNIHAVRWFKRARFDGRNQVPLPQDEIESTGWNMYLTPEQAARGLTLFETIKDKNLPDIDSTLQGYPDLSKIKAYQCAKS